MTATRKGTTSRSRSRSPESMTTIVIRNIPYDLKKRFKVLCSMKDVSQQDQVIKLITKWVADREKHDKDDE